MDYSIQTMEAVQVIGVSGRFSGETSYQEIPKFWDRHWACRQKGEYSPEMIAALERCSVGEFGICICDDLRDGTFRYMIAGRYDGGTVPEGLEVYTLPGATWARFRSIGPLPDALQGLNTEIFQSWLPENPQYEMDGSYSVEWYSCGDGSSADYESAIWIPVKEK